MRDGGVKFFPVSAGAALVSGGVARCDARGDSGSGRSSRGQKARVSREISGGIRGWAMARQEFRGFFGEKCLNDYGTGVYTAESGSADGQFGRSDQWRLRPLVPLEETRHVGA